MNVGHRSCSTMKHCPLILLFLFFLALPTIVLGVYWAPVIDLADRSVHFFLG